MPNIENVTKPYTLPEDALCLTPQGWQHETHEVVLQFNPPMTLAAALENIWAQQRGLLGVGELHFKQTGDQPYPKGYVVFVPESD